MPIPVAPVVPTDPYFGDWTGTLGGLNIGAGSSYKIVGVTGWHQMQAAALGGLASQSPKAFANASYPLPYFMPERVVTVLLDIETTPGQMPTVVGALTQVTQPGVLDVPLSLQVGGVTTTVYGSISNRDISTDLAYLVGFAQATVEVTCEDARRLGAALSSTTQLPSSTGGLAWPLTWPLTWTGTQVTGECTLTNPGNAVGPLSLRINGPVSGPMVTCAGSSMIFRYAGSVAAGDWLDVDMEARTVLYNGQASRASLVTSRGWFGFPPGDMTVGFNADSYDPAASLTVTASPAWI